MDEVVEQLPSQVVVITGASRGVGFETARELAYRGHQVIATMRNPDRDGPAVIAGYENRIQAIRCDIGERDSTEAAAAFALERHGRIDALVNNAALLLIGAIEEVVDDEMHDLFNTNLTGQMRMTQAVLPAMREQKSGKIITVSSLAGKISGPAFGPYCASKWALEGLMESLRYELAPLGIEVSLILMGAYRTQIQFKSTFLTKKLQDGVSAYQAPCEAFVKGEQVRANLNPGVRTVACNIADAIEFPDPLAPHIPVGFDVHRVMPLRQRMTHDEFEAMISSMRNEGFPGSWFGTIEANPPVPIS